MLSALVRSLTYGTVHRTENFRKFDVNPLTAWDLDWSAWDLDLTVALNLHHTSSLERLGFSSAGEILGFSPITRLREIRELHEGSQYPHNLVPDFLTAELLPKINFCSPNFEISKYFKDLEPKITGHLGEIRVFLQKKKYSSFLEFLTFLIVLEIYATWLFSIKRRLIHWNDSEFMRLNLHYRKLKVTFQDITTIVMVQSGELQSWREVNDEHDLHVPYFQYHPRSLPIKWISDGSSNLDKVQPRQESLLKVRKLLKVINMYRGGECIHIPLVIILM